MTLDIAIRKQLDRFTLDVAFASSAPVVALFGRSGAGKTSLVNCLAGISTPDAGRIAIDGTVLFDSEAQINLPPERRHIGYVFQDSLLFPHMNVERNLQYGAHARSTKRSTERSAEHPERPVIDAGRVLKLLGLEDLLTRRPANLSGGEKQRVAIGRALLSNPRILLMDEPLASLDGERRHEILSYIETLRDQLHIPIVFVSHSVPEVTRLADELVLLAEGRIIASGEVHEVMGRLDLYPHTGRHEAGAVVDAVVVAHDDTYELSTLAFGGGTLHLPRIAAQPNDSLRLRIRARDVALATERPTGISMQNILEGQVVAMTADGGAIVEVRVQVGSTFLTARVTRRAVDTLQLAPGKAVYALIKAVSLDRRSAGQA